MTYKRTCRVTVNVACYSMAMNEPNMSIFAPLPRSWWRQHMSETFSCGTIKLPNQQPNKHDILFVFTDWRHNLWSRNSYRPQQRILQHVRHSAHSQVCLWIQVHILIWTSSSIAWKSLMMSFWQHRGQLLTKWTFRMLNNNIQIWICMFIFCKKTFKRIMLTI